MAMSQAPGVVDPWMIQPRERLLYKEQFESLKPNNGVVTGEQAKGFLLKSQLPPSILGQIWGLSDTDSDGKMDINEFSIACKLINLKLRGIEVPKTLPPSLVQSLNVPVAGVTNVIAPVIPATAATISNGAIPVQPIANMGSLVNLKSQGITPQAIPAPPRPAVAPITPQNIAGGIPLGSQPVKPIVPPMQMPIASQKIRENVATSDMLGKTNTPNKPPARPAPPLIGNVNNNGSGVPQRPAPPGSIGAGFVGTSGVLPPSRPGPPSFPNSPASGAVAPPLVPGLSQLNTTIPMNIPSGMGLAQVAPIVPMNTNPVPIQAFGMGTNVSPLIKPLPISGVLSGVIPQIPSNNGIQDIQPMMTNILTQMTTGSVIITTMTSTTTTAAVAAATSNIGNVPTMSSPISTSTPLSTIARPPSIDRVGSIDSVHSQHSQHSQHSSGTPHALEWSVPHQTKLKYTQLFNTWDRTRSGFLSGPQARNIMVQSQLPQSVLAQIWSLADMDSDGRLGCEEFVLAMHLCDMAKGGELIPPNLPPDLIPPTFRKQRKGSESSSSQGLPETIDPSAGMPQSSFEDKRKENFEKGQAELERRRKAFLEIQQKEQAERERKEREEAEKQEKIRIEQERRRQAEIEKQLMQQREIEQEKEEQRKRAQEQREAARKEMERQRQLEWETQKSQELQAQRQKEQEILLKLKAKNQSLTIELGSLNDKVKELSQKICDTRVGVSGVKTTIDGMRSTRDSQLQEMAALKNKLREQNQRLLALNQEKAKIDAKNKLNAAQDAAGQEAIKMAFANKQIALKQMRDKINDMQQQINDKMSDIENNNGQLEDIKNRIRNLVSECKILCSTFQTKKSKVMELRGTIENTGDIDYTSSAWAESAWGSTDNQTSVDDNQWPIDNNNETTDELAAGVRKYRAIFEFVARNDEEISFQPGDIIIVPPVQNQEPGWMAGEIRGRTGWFPESYVEPVDAEITFDDSKTFVQQDSVEKRPLEEIAEVPENVSDAGSAGEITSAQIITTTAANTATTDITPASNDISTGQTTVADVNEEYYIALYQYSSAEPDDLSFNEGEIITVTKKEGQWWMGYIGERSGYFPSNYVDTYVPNINQIAAESVVPVEETVQPQTQSTPLTVEKTAEQIEDDKAAAEDRAELPDFTQMASQQSRGKKPEIVQVIAPYQATSSEQLNLQKGQLIMIRKKSDTGWWEGELQARGKKRQIGWFPASYVKALISSSNRSTPVSHGYQDSPTDPNAERVMALYPHQAQNDDELSFEKGDVITVLGKPEESWWKGELNGITGIFPSNYVSPMCDNTMNYNYFISLMNPMEKKRQGYIKELIETEEAYIDDMRLVHEVFEKPLLHSLVLSVEEIEKIFVNWRDIIACNDNFLRTLRIRRDNSDNGLVRMIGDIFCENIPRMEAYIRFCSCQISAAAYLQTLTETNPEFVKVAQSCQKDVRTKGMPLSSFLIKPIQRITKYPLIISKILENTSTEHPDRLYLQEALAKAEEFCTQINEGVREKENSNRLEWLQSHVSYNEDSLQEKLIFNSLTNSAGPRKLLHYGILHKAKSGKELVVFLTNDFLLFVQPMKTLPTGQFSFERNENSKFKLYRKPIFLNELNIVAQSEINGNISDSSRILCLKDSTKKPIVLLATTSNDYLLWVKKITEAKKQYVKNEKNLLQRQRSRQAQFISCGRILVTVVQGSSLKASAVRRKPLQGCLFLVVVEAEDLIFNKRDKCNAFAKVSMGSQEETTPVVTGTECLIWDTSMQFQIKDLYEDTLCLTVFDKGYYTPDDFLGRAEVRVSDIMRDCKDSCGPIQKRIKLHEVDRGEVVIKLDLQLFGN